MSPRKLITMVLLVGITTATSAKQGRAQPVWRKPLPEGVIEVTRVAATGSIVALKDGSLLLAQGRGYRLSKDGGKTWGKGGSLDLEVGGMIRLKSGALGLYGGPVRNRYFSSSTDEGKTWAKPISLPSYGGGFHPMHHSLIQLSTGRLILVGYAQINFAAPDVSRYSASNWGVWRGIPIGMEGHRSPEMGIVVVFYSDDEGKTWKQSGGKYGGLFGWFDERGIPNGKGGITGVFEPTAAETKDGRVLLFARSKCGRLVQSYSITQGEIWHSILPTELASSAAPPMLVQIPSTADLLCVWNQVSGEEIRRGWHRGRLSVAISKDSGLTWENFKTLELQEGMDDVARIAPEFPIAREVRGRPGLGQLVDGFTVFDYSNVDFVNDQVFIRYGRRWMKGAEKPNTTKPSRKWADYEKQEKKMPFGSVSILRIYPLEWFYK